MARRPAGAALVGVLVAALAFWPDAGAERRAPTRHRGSAGPDTACLQRDLTRKQTITALSRGVSRKRAPASGSVMVTVTTSRFTGTTIPLEHALVVTVLLQ